MNTKSGLAGKTVLFVNSGGKKKRFTIERARKLGMTIVLLDKAPDQRKQHIVDYFIEADTFNHEECIKKIEAFLRHNPHVKFDGAITFWEDDVPLLGRICEKLNLPGNTYKTAVVTRNKFAMRKRLQETGLGIPMFHMVRSKRDLQKAIERIGFPAVMKPAWGADSEFVVLVNNVKEAEVTLRYLLLNCTEQFNPIFKYNEGMFLYEEYMEGMEVSVECYAQYGIPHTIGINEKYPMKLPYFVERGDCAPARLDEETEKAVIKLAESAMIALGVADSLAHIEIKTTPQGPKIVEVGSRMGGDDIYLYVKHSQDENLVDIGLQVACGVYVQREKKTRRECVACEYFIPPYSGIVSGISYPKDILKSPSLIHLSLTKKVGDAVLVPPEGYENAGWVVASGKTHQQAQAALERIMGRIEFNVTKFHRDSSLGKTSREHALDTASVVRSQIIEASRLAKLRSSNLKDMRSMYIGILSNSPAGESVRSMLMERGYHADLIDVSQMPIPIRKIQDANFNFVLNLCEADPNAPFLGVHIAALLEMLHLPFSGSSSATIAAALDKIDVKKMLDYHNIPTPEWDYIEEIGEKINPNLEFPLMVKPALADNYYGIGLCSVVTNERELKKQLRTIVQDMRQPALIEEYIEGDEIDACVLGNGDEAEVLPLIRSVFDKMPEGHWHIYTWELMTEKYQDILKSIRVEKPAKIPPKLDKLVSEIALDMFSIFDCRDYAEIEMRIDREGNPFVLELNPNPGIEPTDFLPSAAKLAGYDYGELLESIIWSAVEWYKRETPAWVRGTRVEQIAS
ncbi:MAG: ATP-grasp domain-containing protein [Candidatus Peribacteraceae bacterium]|nr:ATP-grasp domain-containing protein [Candidatus Peribacteraceae bacterium]